MRKSAILFVCVLFLIDFAACQGDDNSSWPPYVRESMRMPEQARNVQFKSFKGSYQLVYNANVCFPARGLIDSTAKSMLSAHWERLVFDPLNPGTKLSYAVEKDGKTGVWWWSTYPWKEYWKDKSGNIVHFQFSYDVDDPFLETLPKSCSLKGLITFCPKNVWESALRALEADKRKMGLK